jgi:hypothetical protein
MARLGRKGIMLKWCPSPTRRALTLYALAVSTFIVILRISLIPWSWRYVGDIYLDVLLWLVCVPSIVLLCLDLRRVFPPGHCQECGYDLAGKNSGACPECGQIVGLRPAPKEQHFSTARLGRKGRVLKCLGLIACLLIVQAGIVSAFGELTYRTGASPSPAGSVARPPYTFLLRLADGELLLLYSEDGPSKGEKLGWELRPNSNPRWGDFQLVIGFLDDSWLSLPLWIPLVIIAIPTAFLFWRDRRIPLGQCQKCRYDLTGNVSGVCPECGEKVPPQHSA